MPDWLSTKHAPWLPWLLTGTVLLVLWSWTWPIRLPDRELTIGFAVSPPYAVKTKGGGYEGLSVEVISEAARRRGIRLRWKEFLAPAPDEAILGGQVDLWPMVAITEERKQRYHMTGRWLHTYYCLLSLEHNWIRDAAGAKGRRVSHADAIRTRSLARATLPEAILREKPTRDDVIASLCRQEVDAAFVETRGVEAALMDRPEVCRDSPLRIALVNGANFPSGVASTFEAAPAADAIREEIVNLARDGTMARIFSRWNLASSADTNIIYDLLEAQDRAVRLRWLTAALVLVMLMMGVQYVRTREARKAADLANAAKSEFVANMSHEIRTPLNGVLGLSAMLAEAPIPAAQKELVRDLTDCSETLLAVINDILDFSKIEAGKLAVESAPFNLRESIRAATAAQAQRARQKGLAWEVSVDDAVPAWVAGDPGRLKQVLLNLVSNAVKFTHSGGVQVKAGMAPDGTVSFSVIDTGIGMDEAAAAHLFQPFTQADSTTTRKYGGTGLGLAICKRLAGLMNGEIGARSTLGVGSHFWFRLPLPAAAPVAKSGRMPALAGGPRPASIQRILLAEDNAVNRRVVEHLIRKQGLEVTSVDDGRKAVDAVRLGGFSLVLMDCQMPEMDGYQAAAHIRDWEKQLSLPRIPIVALTAHAMLGDREKCLASGMDDYLTKPVNPQVLAQALANWLDEEPGAPGETGLEQLSQAVSESSQEANTRAPSS